MNSLKLALLSALGILLTLCGQAFAQPKIYWESGELCNTCVPRIAWFTDSLHGNLYTSDDWVTGARSTDHYTSNGGRTWKPRTDTARLWSFDKLTSVISILDTDRFFWHSDRTLYYTTNAGISWRKRDMFPVPARLRMFTPDTGIGIVASEGESGYIIEVKHNTDSGFYWYESLGSSYTHEAPLSDAIILSDQEFLVAHIDWNGELMRTEDGGQTWKSVLKFSAQDSIIPSKLRQLNNTNIVLLETYLKESLFISMDRGNTWSKISRPKGLHLYRTRLASAEDGKLILWSLAGTILGNTSERLLEPDFWEAYATTLLVSVDTGASWSTVSVPGFPSSAHFFDIIPIGNTLNVTAYADSITYIAHGTLDITSSVDAGRSAVAHEVAVYPNPIAKASSFKLAAPSAACNEVMILDLHGAVVSRLQVKGHTYSVELKAPDAAGVYQAVFLQDGERVATSRLVVY